MALGFMSLQNNLQCSLIPVAGYAKVVAAPQNVLIYVVCITTSGQAASYFASILDQD